MLNGNRGLRATGKAKTRGNTCGTLALDKVKSCWCITVEPLPLPLPEAGGLIPFVVKSLNCLKLNRPNNLLVVVVIVIVAIVVSPIENKRELST
jgi:hypothetical protein